MQNKVEGLSIECQEVRLGLSVFTAQQQIGVNLCLVEAEHGPQEVVQHLASIASNTILNKLRSLLRIVFVFVHVWVATDGDFTAFVMISKTGQSNGSLKWPLSQSPVTCAG